jgi:hypothetical protein
VLKLVRFRDLKLDKEDSPSIIKGEEAARSWIISAKCTRRHLIQHRNWAQSFVKVRIRRLFVARLSIRQWPVYLGEVWWALRLEGSGKAGSIAGWGTAFPPAREVGDET